MSWTNIKKEMPLLAHNEGVWADTYRWLDAEANKVDEHRCTMLVMFPDKPPYAYHQVNMYTWGEYDAPKVMKDFEAEVGPTLKVSSYSSNEEMIAKLVEKHFDLRPKGIIHSLDLLRPIYEKTAAYGHFGREEPEFTWERTDRAAALADAAGIKRKVA
jgi:hypothetical protein